jgi:hypothetical protein
VEAYDEFGTEILEAIDAGPWVICDTRWYGRGKGSGVVIDVRAADAYEIRDGMIVRSNGGYQDAAAALAAVARGSEDAAEPCGG